MAPVALPPVVCRLLHAPRLAAWSATVFGSLSPAKSNGHLRQFLVGNFWNSHRPHYLVRAAGCSMAVSEEAVGWRGRASAVCSGDHNHPTTQNEENSGNPGCFGILADLGNIGDFPMSRVDIDPSDELPRG